MRRSLLNWKNFLSKTLARVLPGSAASRVFHQFHHIDLEGPLKINERTGSTSKMKLTGDGSSDLSNAKVNGL